MIYHTHTSNPNGCGDPNTLDDLQLEVQYACAELIRHMGEFDVIVATGLSGVLPAVGVSLRLNLPLAILRKEDDGAHQVQFCGSDEDYIWINGHTIKDARALWLDDFIGVGSTRDRVRAAVQHGGGKVVAEYLTQGRSYANTAAIRTSGYTL